MASRNKRRPKQAPRRQQTTRSVPYIRSFVRATFWSLFHYLSIVCFITALVMFCMTPTLRSAHLIAGSLVAAAFTWLIAFFKRRAVFCPLCKGTPLLNSGALTHANSQRIWPFNEGTTALLRIMFTQKFRCMYCGTPYDMLKEPSISRRRKLIEEDE